MASTVDLPDGDSPTIALLNPTEAEKLIQFKLNGAYWRGALSLPAYLRREAVLAQQSLTKDGGIAYWILVDTAMKSNPLEPESDTRLPLASCETYRKRALVGRDGRVEDVICYGIGSVFCGPHLRRRGYAQRMMQELGKTLRTHQADGKECMFSILYSDIGKQFYANAGWEPRNSSHVALPGIASSIADLPVAQPLFAEDLPELCRIDEALIRKRLESRAAGSNVAVAVVPDVETVQWHHAREEFVSMELYGNAPKVKGAIVGSEQGKRVWCYWTRQWDGQLYILRLVVEDEDRSISGSHYDAAIAALLAMAQREAEKCKLKHVEMWNPSELAMAGARRLDPNAKITERESESITSLLWLPEHDGPMADKIDWVYNEKYAWC